MTEVNSAKCQINARRRLMRIGAEVLLIIAIIALSAAILTPLLKKASSDSKRQPEFDDTKTPAGNIYR